MKKLTTLFLLSTAALVTSSAMGLTCLDFQYPHSDKYEYTAYINHTGKPHVAEPHEIRCVKKFGYLYYDLPGNHVPDMHARGNKWVRYTGGKEDVYTDICEAPARECPFKAA